MPDSQSGFFSNLSEPAFARPSSLEPVEAAGSGITRLLLCREGGRNRLFKALAPEFQGDPFFESLLRKEFEIGFSLDHPNICAYYGFRDLPPYGPVIEIEYIKGRTLRDVLADPAALPEKTRRHLALQLLDALVYMHGHQVLHRDLKPENIMVTKTGNNLKIIDFGFSDSDSHYINKGPAGTRSHAAPELLAGETVDQRADIYSLGTILQELTPRYRNIFRKCMATDKDDRYGSAGEVRDAILSFDKRQRFVCLVTSSLILLALVGGIVVTTLHRSGSADVDQIFEKAERQVEMAAGVTVSEPSSSRP